MRSSQFDNKAIKVKDIKTMDSLQARPKKNRPCINKNYFIALGGCLANILKVGLSAYLFIQFVIHTKLYRLTRAFYQKTHGN